MFTIDASVHINALNSAEEGSLESQVFLEQTSRRPWPTFSPTLLLVEVATAVARAFDNAERGAMLAQAVRNLPAQIWVPLDESLADEAARLGAERRLRGADAVYAAVARRVGTALITCDRQQPERVAGAVTVLAPAKAIEELTTGLSGV